MSTLILIRHAQASFMMANYDHLSPLGFDQSRILGDYWANKNFIPNRIYVGPLKRHQQTYEEVKAAYDKRKITLPQPNTLDELAEHQGPEVLAEIFPALISKYEQLHQWDSEGQRDPSLKKKNHLRIFHHFMALWAQDSLGIDHPKNLENWSTFRQRVSKGIKIIMNQSGSGETVWAFTSGGTIAATLGFVLGMQEEARIVELNGKVKNTSFSEFLFSKGRISLRSFNEAPHLKQSELITYV